MLVFNTVEAPQHLAVEEEIVVEMGAGTVPDGRCEEGVEVFMTRRVWDKRTTVLGTP